MSKTLADFERLLARAKFMMVITVAGADYLLRLKKESLNA